MSRIESRFIYMVVGLLLGALVVLFTSGCSTVEGLGALMGGVGADLQDSARGTRNKMSERADR